MKNIVIIFLVTIVFIVGLSGQAVKLAFIDSNRIMAESNDTREIQRIFLQERDAWDSEIDNLTDEVRRLETELETRRLTLTETGKREAEERILAKMRERQQLIERIYGEDGLATQREAELLAPIMAKLRTIIDRIAEEEDFSMIFDWVTSGLIYAKDTMDITAEVISEMNRN